MDEKLKRDIILDNYQNPMNRGLTNSDGYIKVNTRNSSCVDNVDVMAKLENGVFIDIRFDGDACAISTSATSIMIKTLIGKTVAETEKIIENYEKMINAEAYDKELLGELNVYDTVSKQPSRKKCATLPFEAIKRIIEEAKKA